MSRLIDKIWRLWLKDKSQVVRDLAKKYPPGTALEVGHNKTLLHVVGYSDGGCLLVSHTDPCVDYDKAIAEKFHYNPAYCLDCGAPSTEVSPGCPPPFPN